MTSIAISLRQPWAMLMARGIKRIENRSWRSSRRGPVLIHASSWWNAREAAAIINAAARILEERDLPPLDFTLDDARARRGGIVGRFNIVDCVQDSDDPFFFGPNGFVVEDARMLETPVPCPGRLGFFEVPPDVAEMCSSIMGDDR